LVSSMFDNAGENEQRWNREAVYLEFSGRRR
jgi:hypothetical protein